MERTKSPTDSGIPFSEEYLKRTPKSREIYERSKKLLAGGSTRAAVFFPPYPSYLVKGEGCWVYDADGNKILDLLNNYTALILGHAHPKVVAAVEAQLWKGTAYGAPTECEYKLAEAIRNRMPTIEKIRYVNSGTEATMMAILAAMQYTGREKIAKFEGAYHGTHPWALVSQKPPLDKVGKPEAPNRVPDAPGIPKSVVDEVLIMPFNNEAAVERIIKENKKDLAALITEPVMGAAGIIPPKEGFLRFLREITEENNMLLIFDEVITGFRVSSGGAQVLYGVEPDITVIGKIMGGGFPVGALGGRDDIMSQFDVTVEGGPAIPHSGTFNANPITLTAGLATLKELTSDKYEKLESFGSEAQRRLEGLFRDYNVEAKVTRVASLFNIHFTPNEVVDYRSAQSVNVVYKSMLFVGLLNRNVFIAPRLLGCISVPMTHGEIDEFIKKTEEITQIIAKTQLQQPM